MAKTVTTENLAPANTIEEFLDPIKSAIALGAEIPVLIGTYGWILLGDAPNASRNAVNEIQIHGLFQSEEAATRKLAQIVLDRIVLGRGPWMQDCDIHDDHLEVADILLRKEIYIGTHSPDDIVLWANKNVSPTQIDHFRISHILVSPETPLNAGRVQ